MSTEPCSWDFQVEELADGTLVRFIGRKVHLNNSSLQLFGDRLLQLADEGSGRTVILDLAGVQVLYSAALEKLIKLHKKLRARDGRLILFRLGTNVEEVLKVTQLDKLFDIRPLAEVPTHWQGLPALSPIN